MLCFFYLLIFYSGHFVSPFYLNYNPYSCRLLSLLTPDSVDIFFFFLSFFCHDIPVSVFLANLFTILQLSFFLYLSLSLLFLFEAAFLFGVGTPFGSRLIAT